MSNEWKCPHCGHNKFWFDRTFLYREEEGGQLIEVSGPCDRCERCGKEVNKINVDPFA